MRTENREPPPVLARAALLHLEGKPDDALKELERALERRSGMDKATLAAMHSAVGYLQFECGRFEQAAEAYSRLLKLDPRHPSGCYNLRERLEALEAPHS